MCIPERLLDGPPYGWLPKITAQHGYSRHGGGFVEINRYHHPLMPDFGRSELGPSPRCGPQVDHSGPRTKYPVLRIDLLKLECSARTVALRFGFLHVRI